MRRLWPSGVSRRLWRVWQRNFAVYRHNWKISFIPPLLEPLLYLVAFGAGLGELVQKVRYAGVELSYLVFLAPAIIAINVMGNAFYENTYSSFVRMYYQKTYDAMLATPLTLAEIITGEILWGATKALMAGTITLGVITPFRLLHFPHSLLILPVALLGGVVFGCLAMVFTATVPNIEAFNLPVFLFITPMFLFSGTFFPIDALPGWAQAIAWSLPLTHLVRTIRGLGLGMLDDGLWISVGYLAVLAVVLLPLAVVGMQRRLIR